MGQYQMPVLYYGLGSKLSCRAFCLSRGYRVGPTAILIHRTKARKWVVQQISVLHYMPQKQALAIAEVEVTLEADSNCVQWWPRSVFSLNYSTCTEACPGPAWPPSHGQFPSVSQGGPWLTSMRCFPYGGGTSHGETHCASHSTEGQELTSRWLFGAVGQRIWSNVV